LASLQGYLETLQYKSAQLGAEERRAYLEIALRQSRQLGSLVGKLFELAKLDTREVELLREPFVLEDLVQDVVQEYELAASEKGVGIATVLPPELPLVNGDIGLIERVLKNLIDNALRHTPAGGTITVALAVEPTAVAVSVSDTGSGIAAEDLPRVFDRFYRGEKSRRDCSDSAGLGLAIAKRIVELHEGSISAASTPGVVTTLQFRLPHASVPGLPATGVAPDAQRVAVG
ncbi:MAG TPA: HAMP domain-containing sensor histidine kinase, partial [Burkholderiales bacterium]|nr:HAMP domain-containing sensor histidine kinase [Burkholderiales bacterium]